MSSASRSEFTEILHALQANTLRESAATDRAFEIAYQELRDLAAAIMRGERPDHSLQPTEVVHEVYRRLVDPTRLQFEGRAHFFGIAARAMRQMLVDHARRHRAEKRGGDRHRVTLGEALDLATPREVEVLELDEMLDRLTEMDARMAQVVELRVFGGLTAEEVAKALEVSRGTVRNDWRVARMWLRRDPRAQSAS